MFKRGDKRKADNPAVKFQGGPFVEGYVRRRKKQR
jgi:hypothetical protein